MEHGTFSTYLHAIVNKHRGLHLSPQDLYPNCSNLGIMKSRSKGYSTIIVRMIGARILGRGFCSKILFICVSNQHDLRQIFETNMTI